MEYFIFPQFFVEKVQMVSSVIPSLLFSLSGKLIQLLLYHLLLQEMGFVYFRGSRGSLSACLSLFDDRLENEIVVFQLLNLIIQLFFQFLIFLNLSQHYNLMFVNSSRKNSLLKRLLQHQSQNLQTFWKENSEKLVWFKKPVETLTTHDNKEKWFPEGKLNLAFNCLERTCAVKNLAESPALIYQNISQAQTGYVSYKQLKKKVATFTKKLQKLQLKKGDRVLIYLPNTLQAAEAILACSALGIVFEFIVYGMGTLQLSNSIREISPSLIITTSCTVESDGIRQNKYFVDKAKKETNQMDLRVLILQRSEKKLLELERGDIDFDSINIDAEDFNIDYAFTDSSDPLYIFNSFSYSRSYIRTHKLIRETGSYAVGLEYSMMKHLGVFQGDSMLTLSNFGSCLGLSYALFGPLLRGASSLIMEDSYSFMQEPQKVLRENNIKTLYIHGDQMQKLIQTKSDMIKDSDLDFLFVQENIRDEIFEQKLIKDCHKYDVQINNTFFNSELGVVAACEDWTDTKPKKSFQMTPAAQIELEGREYEHKDQNFIFIKNSYPGQFTRFLNSRRGMTHPSQYYSHDGAMNTFQQGLIQDGNVNLVNKKNLDVPYNVIQGTQILKKQIISELIKWEQIHFVYILPLKDSEDSSFVIFLEVDDKLITGNQEMKDNFLESIKQSMQDSIGDIFDLDEILIFPRLPKRIREDGSVGVDKHMLRKLLDADVDDSLFKEKQEVFDFKELLNQLSKNNQL